MYSDNDFGGPLPSEIMLPCQKEFIFGRVYDPEKQTVLYHCKYHGSAMNVGTKDITYNIGLHLDDWTLKSFIGQCCHYCNKNNLHDCNKNM